MSEIHDRGDAGNYLLYWRNRKHASLRQLSARIETSGRAYASTNRLNRWEKGETPLPDWAVPELATALRIS